MFVFLDEMPTEDINDLIKACENELKTRDVKKFNNLQKNVLDAIEEMVKHYPHHSATLTPNLNWTQLYQKIKAYEYK